MESEVRGEVDIRVMESETTQNTLMNKRERRLRGLKHLGTDGIRNSPSSGEEEPHRHRRESGVSYLGGRSTKKKKRPLKYRETQRVYM